MIIRSIQLIFSALDQDFCSLLVFPSRFAVHLISYPPFTQIVHVGFESSPHKLWGEPALKHPKMTFMSFRENWPQIISNYNSDFKEKFRGRLSPPIELSLCLSVSDHFSRIKMRWTSSKRTQIDFDEFSWKLAPDNILLSLRFQGKVSGLSERRDRAVTLRVGVPDKNFEQISRFWIRICSNRGARRMLH